MKFKKVIALMIAASMVAAVAGCSKVKKITAEDFADACEKIGAEEVDYDDMSDVDASDREDGVYCVLDSDDIEDMYEQYENSSSAGSLGMVGMSMPDASSFIDADDMENMTVLIKMDDNIDDINDPEDIEDLDVNMLVGIHVTLTAADMAEDIMDNMADSLDDMDIDVEDLSSDEYYVGKNEAYLRFNVSAEDLIAAFLESETCGYLDDMDIDVEDYVEGLTGDLCIATYINGENMVVVIGASVNNATEFLDEFCGDLGISSPSSLDSNTMVAEAICDYIDNTVGAMLSAFAAYSY